MEQPEKIEQLPVSDWTDQDLLTKDEARERLISEIGRAKAQLDHLQVDDPGNEAAILLLARRLNAMESIRGEYDSHLDRS